MIKIIIKGVTLELDGVLIAKTPDDFSSKGTMIEMMQNHKADGAPEVLEGREFRLSWTKDGQTGTFDDLIIEYEQIEAEFEIIIIDSELKKLRKSKINEDKN